MDITSIIEQILTILGTIVGTVTVTVLTLRKKLVADKLDITKASSEQNIIKFLETARDDALKTSVDLKQLVVELERERTQFITTIQEQNSNIENLTNQVKLLNDIIKALQTQLASTKIMIDEHQKYKELLLKKLQADGDKLS